MGEAARAQDDLCRQAERHRRLAERTAAALAKQPPRAFSWIRDRMVWVADGPRGHPSRDFSACL